MFKDLSWQQVLTDPDKLRALTERSPSVAAALCELGIRPRTFYYEKFRDACRGFNIPLPQRESPSPDIPRKYRETESAFSDVDRLKIAAQERSLNAAIAVLGVPACGGNYERFTKACQVNGIEPPKPRKRSAPTSPKKSREAAALDVATIVTFATEGRTISEACEALGVHATRHYRERVSKIAREEGKPFAWGPRPGMSRPRIPIKDLLQKGRAYDQARLKRRLVKEGVLDYRCVGTGCGLEGEWLGRPIVLQLDHVNGDPTDNRLANLRFLCPNCHSQTKTFVRGARRVG